VAQIDLIEPALNQGKAKLGGTVLIDREVTVTWSGGTPGQTVFFDLYGVFSQAEVSCAWDATIGTGTIAKSLLHSLIRDSKGSVTWGQELVQDYPVGSYTVTLWSEASFTRNLNF
jgi:hypothetical protein